VRACVCVCVHPCAFPTLIYGVHLMVTSNGPWCHFASHNELKGCSSHAPDMEPFKLVQPQVWKCSNTFATEWCCSESVDRKCPHWTHYGSLNFKESRHWHVAYVLHRNVVPANGYMRASCCIVLSTKSQFLLFARIRAE